MHLFLIYFHLSSFFTDETLEWVQSKEGEETGGAMCLQKFWTIYRVLDNSLSSIPVPLYLMQSIAQWIWYHFLPDWWRIWQNLGIYLGCPVKSPVNSNFNFEESEEWRGSIFGKGTYQSILDPEFEPRPLLLQSWYHMLYNNQNY